ncbi:MAG: alpha-glucuronidase family glycosyl hydrolase, partial [Planctomycetota bacterium]|nr:alpha-glucuronidase family glycosyl hydrolase [Planctomycetota bacterium]
MRPDLVRLAAVLAFLWTAAAVPARGAAEADCPLVPVPKSYHDHGRAWELSEPQQAAIALGAEASETERYAAERLQAHVERRFKQRIPIVVESAVAESVRQVFLLGQRSSNPWVDKLCREQKIGLGDAEPVADGFLIECVEDGGRQVVLVAGGNPRGVVYGADAVFDLMRAEAGRTVWPVVSVRDWPSIPWRGRPHSVLRQHLVPGALDAYIRARLNFTDVRDNPHAKASNVYPARKASMGFPAGVPIDSETVER